MPTRLVLVSAVALLAFTLSGSQRGMTAAPAPVKARLDEALKPLQGTWTLTSYSVDGRLLRDEDVRSTLTIEDDRWSIRWPKDGGVQVEQGTVKIVEAAGRQKVMDLLHDHGPYKGTTTRALYQADAESL